MAVVQNVYAYRMPAGIPGRVNREQEHTGEPNQLDASNPPLAYGDPVKMGSNGRIQALAPVTPPPLSTASSRRPSRALPPPPTALQRRCWGTPRRPPAVAAR